MKEDIVTKVREVFSAMSILKDSVRANSLFAGRNLPSFVKDYLLKRHLDLQTGDIDTHGLSLFLDRVIPSETGMVKDRILSGEEVSLLCRFGVNIDLVKGQKQFAIPDYGVKLREGIIPEYVYRQHQGGLGDGEKWGIVKLCLLPDEEGGATMCRWLTTSLSSPTRRSMLTIGAKRGAGLPLRSGSIS